MKKGFIGLSNTFKVAEKKVPENKTFNERYLDSAVIEYIHELNKENKDGGFDTVRGAFQEGAPVFKGTHITEKNHIQICVRNQECIKGYFLPRPLKKYNPY